MGRGVREREVIVGERNRGGYEKEEEGRVNWRIRERVMRERREDKGGRDVEGDKVRERRKGEGREERDKGGREEGEGMIGEVRTGKEMKGRGGRNGKERDEERRKK